MHEEAKKSLKRKIRVVATILAILFLACIFFVFTHKDIFLRYEIVSRFVPLYRSFKKIPDIFFFPYNFRNSELENYAINITPENLNKINSALPRGLFGSANYLNKDNKVFVKGFFSTSDYSDEVKIRYRGNVSNHWNSYKKSYLIEFPDENLFRGQKAINLVIPSDREYLAMSLNNYRASKLGLIYPKESYARVSLNGSDRGVYLVFEKWGQEWLEKNPVSPSSILIGIDETSDQSVLEEVKSVYSDNAAIYWKSWNAEQSMVDDVSSILIWLASHASEEDFKKYAKVFLDLESFYSRDIISILSGGFHNSSNHLDANNLILYFDGTTGKVVTIPYNSGIWVGGYNGSPTTLWERIVSIPEFRDKRDDNLKEYLSQEKEDDISFLENFLSKMGPEFLSDSAKPINNFSYLVKIDKLKKEVARFFSDPFNKLETRYIGFEVDNTPIVFPDRFKNLSDVVKTPREFVRSNPQFEYDGQALHLYPGKYLINKNVIIPRDTKLVISDGVEIYLGEDVSLVSYSPVIAQGTTDKPIVVTGYELNSNWGVFAVINSHEESIFEHVMFEGGSEAEINGVFITGMLALHNSPAKIVNSEFRDNGGDDALNAKASLVSIENNIFENTFSDGVDIDYVESESIIKSNKFVSIGGDALDISWSDPVVYFNFIEDCQDKGISVGESSQPKILMNIISNCGIGLASKDLSQTFSIANLLIGNRIALSAYQKKDVFGAARLYSLGDFSISYYKEYQEDSLSNIFYLNL